MMFNNYVCALDIGSSRVSAAAAKMQRKKPTEFFFDSLPCRCLERGAICDSIELVNTITLLMKRLKQRCGFNLKFVYCAISGESILAKHSRAAIPLAERGNKVITLSDVRRADEQARILGSSLEEEIIHTLPFSYMIDAKNNIVNPIGLYGHKLEVDLYLVCAKLSSYQSVIHAISQAGYETKRLIYSGIATSRAVFSDELKTGTHIICDLGADSAQLLLYKNGRLNHIEILACGGDLITRALAEELKIPFELAEDVKRSHASVGDRQAQDDEKEILVKKNNIYKPVKYKNIAGISAARTQEVCRLIKQSVDVLLPSEQIDTFIVCGRATLLEGFLETLEQVLGICVKLGKINTELFAPALVSHPDLAGQKYLLYTACLGALSYAQSGKEIELILSQQVSSNLLMRGINRAREIYQEYF